MWSIKKILTVSIILTFLLSLSIWFFRFEIFGGKMYSSNLYISQKMADCYKLSQKYQCNKEIAEDFLSKYSLEEILKVFDVNEKQPVFFENCHSVAHSLGQNEYQRTRDLRKVFEESSRACLGGVYHGAVEGYFMEKNISPGEENTEETMKEVSRICGKSEEYKRPQDFIECNHGLGHALMYVVNNNLPKALDYCDAISLNNSRELCYTGALMSNNDSFGSTEHPTQYVKSDDPLYPCNILKKHQQNQCYSYGVLNRFQYDLPKSIKICLSVPTDYQHSCFETIGRDRTIITADPIILKNQCETIPEPDFKKDCFKGTSYNTMVRFGSKSEIPLNYCAILGSEFTDLCYSRLLDALKRVESNSQNRKNFCEKIPFEQFKKECLTAEN